MNKIEDFWKDITVYYIEFVAVKESSMRTHCKVLVLKSGLHEDEVNELVKTYFNNISEVTCIDELYDGLRLKEKFYKSNST